MCRSVMVRATASPSTWPRFGVRTNGSAQALTFAVVEHKGMAVYGVDDGTIQITI